MVSLNHSQYNISSCLPNGLRYLRVGGRGFCLGAGKNSKPEKCLKMPQNPTRQVHALLAGFVQDALINNQNHCHKTDEIIARTLLFRKNQKTGFSKTLAKKILNLFAPSCLLKKDNFYMLTKMLAEKMRLLLLSKLTPRKDKPILKTYANKPRTKPKQRNKANQNHCKPKR
jgi:hypothetical protein